MINIHKPSNNEKTPLRYESLTLDSEESIPHEALWIDLISPSPTEDKIVEAFIEASIPTRAEMQVMEPSELLYVEDDARFMTARILCQSDSHLSRLTPISFILKNNRLISLRYERPKSFDMFSARLIRPNSIQPSGESILVALFETVIDRAVEIMQLVSDRIDLISTELFDVEVGAKRPRNGFQITLQTLAREGDRISKVRESLVSIERLLLFLSNNTAAPSKSDPFKATQSTAIQVKSDLNAILRDLQSLEDHASFLSGKIQFLLDASLGMLNLEQNNIVKIFSVAAVIFMPPTLVASIYGMNFKFMPELEWSYGYPMALGLMIIAAILPYLFFRWKRWL